MVISIEKFSRATVEGVRTFLAEHPPVEIRVTRRNFDMASRPLRIVRGTCECGHVWVPDPVFIDSLTERMKVFDAELPKGALPGDFYDAIEVKHAWDVETRSQYCGKRITVEVVAVT